MSMKKCAYLSLSGIALSSAQYFFTQFLKKMAPASLVGRSTCCNSRNFRTRRENPGCLAREFKVSSATSHKCLNSKE